MSTRKISKVNKFEIDSSKRKTEQALKQSEQRYHQLFNSMTDMFESAGIIYLAMDVIYDKSGKAVDGVFCEINSVTERVLGKRKEQMIGKSRKELFGHVIFDDLLEKFDNVVKTGRPSHFERYGSALQKYYNVYAWKITENRLGIVSTDITGRKKIEEELRRSEEKYSSLFANMIDGLAYCRPIFDNQNRPVDLVCLEINDAFTRITGLKKEDVVGKRIKEVLPEIQKAQPKLFETSGRVALSGKTEKFEIFFKPLSLWFSVSMYSPIKGDFVIMFEDINERKNAEEALRQSEELYRNLFNNSDDGFILAEPIYGEDVGAIDFRFLKVNPAYERQTGTIRTVFEGKKASEIEPNIEPEWILLIGDVAKTGKTVRCENFNQLTGKWFDAHYFPFGVGQVGILFRDITERKKMEAVLKESQKKYQDLIETTSDFIWEIDEFGTYTYCSPQMEKLSGLKPAEMIGKSPFDMMPPEEKKRVSELLKENVKSPKPISGLQIKSYDGKGCSIFLEISEVPFLTLREDFRVS